jgi:hypothetical protein
VASQFLVDNREESMDAQQRGDKLRITGQIADSYVDSGRTRKVANKYRQPMVEWPNTREVP